GWLRRAHLHLSYSMTLTRLLDTTCHTTVRTGPYTAVRDGYAALVDQSRKSEGFELRIRKPHSESLGSGERPRATPAACRVAGQTRGNPSFRRAARRRRRGIFHCRHRAARSRNRTQRVR